MTDKQLAKRMSELCDDFKEMCQARDCDGCEMEAYAKEGVCAHAWIWKRLRADEVRAKVVAAQKEYAAAAAPNESPKAKEEAKLPKWCKVGAWVMSPGGSIGQLVDWQAPCTALVKLGDIEKPFQFSDFDVKPIRFRPYTFEEAEQLLGKKVVATSKTKHSQWTMLITEVSLCDLLEDAPRINNYRQSFLILCNATIDGVPIGVPEVDKEALEGGQK